MSRGSAGALQGGAEGLAAQAAERQAAQGASAWDAPLAAAVHGVRQLGLAAWEPAECLALENELLAWKAAGALGQRDNALRCAAGVGAPTLQGPASVWRCLARCLWLSLGACEPVDCFALKDTKGPWAGISRDVHGADLLLSVHWQWSVGTWHR